MNLLPIHSRLTTTGRGYRFRGWIFYDGGCGLCSTLRQRWGPTVEPRGFRLAALQEPWVQRRLALHDAIPPELKVETADGQLLGGADALLYLARYIWWARPLALVAPLPGFRTLLRRLYRPLATHRHRLSRACGLRPPGASATPADKWLD